MDDESETESDTVAVSLEITGNYDDVMDRLQQPSNGSPGLDPLMGDLETLLETIVQMDGGTRSAIADRLPDAMAVSFDAQAVVDTLQVLERYDLVTLEGNTWKPGPNLDRE
ncbi:hypothetical protein ACFQJ5_11455 [Halomicroarcula sp. GCM10025324]|jgi:hypothetical protein|uniref:hypothetical protein n=1 Tax=Haloarcula TaxID=2237 RepID=UPI0023E76126|nr:hypothetical protein [Halomicroarcula sp. ZS-22-S1]